MLGHRRDVRPDQIEVVVREKAPFVFFAGSIPSGRDIEQAKAGGGKVICFAPVLSLARRLVSGKIRNQRTLLQRNHVESGPAPVETQ